MAATQTISMFRGDDKTVRITVKDGSGALVNITGAHIKFTAATSPTSIAKDSDNGASEVDWTDPTNGEAEIYLVPADTAGATPKEIGSYLFDIEITLSGKTYTLSKGFFQLVADVTT